MTARFVGGIGTPVKSQAKRNRALDLARLDFPPQLVRDKWRTG